MAYSLISLERMQGAIGSLGPKLWIDTGFSFAFQTATGKTAESLPDLSGNRNHLKQFVPSRRPLIMPNGKSSKPVLRFDGTDDWMQCISNADAFKFFNTGQSTIFVVHKPWASTDPNSTGYLLDNISLAGSVGSRSGAYIRMDDRSAQGFNDNAIVVVSSSNSGSNISIVGTAASNGVSPSNQWSINVFRIDPGNITPANRVYLSRNAGSELQGNTNNASLGSIGPAYQLALGACGGDGQAPYQGDIAAVVMFQGLLSLSSCSAVINELNSRWGIY